jgi:hypothetical protein
LARSWEDEMNNYHRVKTVPRIENMHVKKFRSGLKVVFDKITNVFNIINNKELKDKEDKEIYRSDCIQIYNVSSKKTYK